MSKLSIDDIKTAFNSGAGVTNHDLTLIALVFAFGLLFVFGITVIIKKLNMFPKEENAYDLIRVTLTVFLVVIIFVTLIKFTYL